MRSSWFFRNAGFPRVAGLALVVSWAALFSAGPRLHAQEQGSQAVPAASSSGSAERRAQTPEKAESKEADSAASDSAASNDELRNSSAVRWIARVTGLSTDGAFWLCMVLNFLVVFLGLWMLMRKRLPGVFKSRTELIQKRIEEARKTSEEARRRLADVEGRLSRLDGEISEMRREAEENARGEEARMRAELDAERQRIVTTAEQEIAMAANAARRDLKHYAAALAVDLAEKRIRVDRNADQALVREFTASLRRDGN